MDHLGLLEPADGLGVREGAQRWSTTSVRRLMVVFGLVSTAFDLLTFVVPLKAFEAGETPFQSTVRGSDLQSCCSTWLQRS
jgi:hypothetical protein